MDGLEFMNPLSNLLTQPLLINGTNQTLDFQYKLCDYLCVNDLKSLRTVNPFCHRLVSTSSAFGSRVEISISEKWHREYKGLGLNYGTRWEYFVLDQFAYHRRHDLFKHYWTTSTKELKELSIKNCSLECDGLSFILNECHNLQSLEIDNVKLKHWGNKNCARVHESLPVMTNPTVEFNGRTILPQTKAMCDSLRTLKILNLKSASNCTLAYLKDRCGSLQNLVLKGIFQCHSNRHLEDENSPEAIQKRDFSRKFGELVRANAPTLQTLIVEDNKYQEEVLEMLINNIPTERSVIKALEVTIRTAQEKELVQRLLTLPNVRVEDLGIKILERFTEGDVTEVLSLQYDVTKNLKLSFNGYKLNGLEGNNERVEGAELPPLQEVDLQGSIHRFQSLESLTLVDIKAIPERSFRVAKGLRGSRRELAVPPRDVVEWADLKIKSGIHERCLYSMPFALKELTLKEVIFNNPEVTNMASLRNVTGYRNLQKLEIIGPLRYPLKNFRVIPKEMAKLKTLILVDCGLSDEEITGLNKVTASHLKKCGASVFHNLADGSGDPCDLMMGSVDKKVRKLIMEARVYPKEIGGGDGAGAHGAGEGEEAPIGAPVVNVQIRRRNRAQEEYKLPEYLRNKKAANGDDGLTGDDELEGRMEHFEDLVGVGDAQGIDRVEVRDVINLVPGQGQDENNNNDMEQGEIELMEQDLDPIGFPIVEDGVAFEFFELDAELEAQMEAEIEREMMGEAIEDHGPLEGELLIHENNLPGLRGGGDDDEMPAVAQIEDSRSHLFMLKELEHLDLSKNYEVSNVTIYDSLKNPTLKILNLEECTRITDSALEWIAKYHPNLEILHVKGCRRLSQFGFNSLIQKIPKLKRIYTTKKIALDEFECFNVNLSPCYKDITRYPDVTTTRAATRLINIPQDDDEEAVAE